MLRKIISIIFLVSFLPYGGHAVQIQKENEQYVAILQDGTKIELNQVNFYEPGQKEVQCFQSPNAQEMSNCFQNRFTELQELSQRRYQNAFQGLDDRFIERMNQDCFSSETFTARSIECVRKNFDSEKERLKEPLGQEGADYVERQLGELDYLYRGAVSLRSYCEEGLKAKGVSSQDDLCISQSQMEDYLNSFSNRPDYNPQALQARLQGNANQTAIPQSGVDGAGGGGENKYGKMDLEELEKLNSMRKSAEERQNYHKSFISGFREKEFNCSYQNADIFQSRRTAGNSLACLVDDGRSSPLSGAQRDYAAEMSQMTADILPPTSENVDEFYQLMEEHAARKILKSYLHDLMASGELAAVCAIGTDSQRLMRIRSVMQMDFKGLQRDKGLNECFSSSGKMGRVTGGMQPDEWLNKVVGMGCQALSEGVGKECRGASGSSAAQKIQEKEKELKNSQEALSNQVVGTLVALDQQTEKFENGNFSDAFPDETFHERDDLKGQIERCDLIRGTQGCKNFFSLLKQCPRVLTEQICRDKPYYLQVRNPKDANYLRTKVQQIAETYLELTESKAEILSRHPHLTALVDTEKKKNVPLYEALSAAMEGKDLNALNERVNCQLTAHREHPQCVTRSLLNQGLQASRRTKMNTLTENFCKKGDQTFAYQQMLGNQAFVLEFLGTKQGEQFRNSELVCEAERHAHMLKEKDDWTENALIAAEVALAVATFIPTGSASTAMIAAKVMIEAADVAMSSAMIQRAMQQAYERRLMERGLVQSCLKNYDEDLERAIMETKTEQVIMAGSLLAVGIGGYAGTLHSSGHARQLRNAQASYNYWRASEGAAGNPTRMRRMGAYFKNKKEVTGEITGFLRGETRGMRDPELDVFIHRSLPDPIADFLRASKNLVDDELSGLMARLYARDMDPSVVRHAVAKCNR
jgi:hypothetical protein